MWVAAEAAIELPRTSPISVHHAPPAGPVGCVIGSLREDGRTRVFAAQESSLRRRCLYYNCRRWKASVAVARSPKRYPLAISCQTPVLPPTVDDGIATSLLLL